MVIGVRQKQRRARQEDSWLRLSHIAPAQHSAPCMDLVLRKSMLQEDLQRCSPSARAERYAYSYEYLAKTKKIHRSDFFMVFSGVNLTHRLPLTLNHAAVIGSLNIRGARLTAVGRYKLVLHAGGCIRILRRHHEAP